MFPFQYTWLHHSFRFLLPFIFKIKKQGLAIPARHRHSMPSLKELQTALVHRNVPIHATYERLTCAGIPRQVDLSDRP